MSKRVVTIALASTAIGLSAGTLSVAPVSAAPAVVAPAGSGTQAAPVQPTTVAPTDPVAAARAAKRALIDSLVLAGPSTWRGAPLVHPSRVGFYPQVTRWANLVRIVMDQQGIPAAYLPGVLAQIQQESAGDPMAINLWDSNARAGTPSIGLLQVIAPTYQAYARKRFRSLAYQSVPYTNIWAALKYAKRNYGMAKFVAWTAGFNVSY